MKNNLEKRLSAIEARNTRVELDKAWETSLTRRLAVAGLTYGVIVAYLFVTNNNAPFVNGVVPACGFFLSTLILSSLKTFWQSRKK